MKLKKLVSWCFVLIGIASGMTAIVVGEAFSWWWDEGVAFKVYLVGILPIMTALLAIRNPRLAWKLDFFLAPVIFLCRLGSGPSPATMMAALAALVIPGLFWSTALRRQWPLPLAERLLPKSVPLAIVVICMFLFAVFVPGMLVHLSAPWWPPIGDCGGRPLVDGNGDPRGIDFTARIVFIPPKILAPRYYGRSLWAIARIEERFSASAEKIPEMILLRGHFAADDESAEYFVEGRQSHNLLSYVLPTIQPFWCGHTARLNLAQVELRIMRTVSRMPGGRIVGAVYRGSRDRPSPAAGANVLIQGPKTANLATDAEGIFDSPGLPEGRYTVQLIGNEKSSEKYVYDLKTGDVAEVKLFLGAN